VQYYGKFLQNLATEARPLNELVEKKRENGNGQTNAKQHLKTLRNL
jgi:hypothetical protein